MLEDHVKSPSTCRRLRDGPAGPHLDAFVDWLLAKDYRPLSIHATGKSLAAWSDWLRLNEYGEDVAAGLDAYRAALTADGRLHYVNGGINGATTAGALYVRFLRDTGVLAPAPAKPGPREIWPVLADFHAWARQHRGLAQTTIEVYEKVLVDFLERLGDDPAAYTAKELRNYVIERSRPHGRQRGQTIVTAVRGFLRFLVAMGKCRVGMPDAIPTFASWKLSSVPRYLEPEVVQRVIDACAPTTPVLRRDRAVLLLLVRLGLRAGDVRCLTFADIDWQAGSIAVSGKSRRREWLPLPQDVGDAILDYIRHGRPRAPNVGCVFLTAVAPHRPLATTSVRNITDAALRRAGVEAPSRGAHLFRHSAATAMLRQGASLPSIGAVLRHRSPQTTSHYAKVDFASLAEIALPWPEVSPC